MEYTISKKTKKLVDRYLNPNRDWNAKLDREMRDTIREDEPSRAYYRDRVLTFRMMVGSDPEMPSGFEQSRMLTGVIEGVKVTRTADVGMWIRAAALLFTSAALVFVVIPRDEITTTRMTPRGDYVGSRGVDKGKTKAALVIEGIDKSDRSYEIDLSNGAKGVRAGDAIKLSYVSHDPKLRYVFVFGVQPHGEFMWYAPTPEEKESLLVDTEKSKPFEFDATEPHRKGGLKIVAIFSYAPLPLERIKTLGAKGFFKGNNGQVISWVMKSLGLDPTHEVVSVRDTMIHTHQGSKP
jgi:hypothetical protein